MKRGAGVMSGGGNGDADLLLEGGERMSVVKEAVKMTLRGLLGRVSDDVSEVCPDLRLSDVDFFQLVRLTYFSRQRDTRRSNALKEEELPLPILFRGAPSLTFPARDMLPSVVSDHGESPEAEIELPTPFFSLYGPTAPLPSYFTEMVIREEDGSFGRFLDSFNHLLVMLYAEAWRKYRPAAEVAQDGTDRYTVALTAFAGGYVVGSDAPVFERTHRSLDHAALRWTRPKSAWSLAALIRSRFPDLHVGVEPLVERWVRLDKDARNSIGQRNSGLGQNLAMGARIRTDGTTFRVVIDGISHGRFKDFMPLGAMAAPGSDAPTAAARQLGDCVRDMAPSHLGWEVSFRVLGETIPATRLGDGGGRLGLDCGLVTEGRTPDLHLKWYRGACAAPPPSAA